MSMLNFKYGLHNALPEYSASTQGTIFVTADEQAMYIDLPKIQNSEGKEVGGRIRVSQIITLDNIADWQKLTPPYNTESFYYIINANALLKCNMVDGKYEWTQINSTATLDKTVEDLAALIGKDAESGLRGDVAANATAIAEIQKFVNAQPAKDKAQDDAIAALIQRAGVIEDDLGDLGQVIGYIGEFVNVEEIATKGVTPVTNDVALIGGNIMKYDGTEWKSYNDLVQEIENLRALYNELKGSVPTDSAFAELTADVDALKKWKDETVTVTLGDHETRIGNLETGAEDILETIGDAESGLVKDIADNKKAAEAAAQAASAAQGDATQALADAKKANDAIGNADGGLVKDIADNKKAAEDADAKAQGAVNAINNETTGLAAAHAAAKAADDKAGQAVTDAATADAKGQSALDKIGDATGGLVKDIADNAAAAKAADDKAVAADEKAQSAQDDLDTLEGIVGDANGGLVKTVNQNISDIAQLGIDLGAETTARENAIAGLKTELLSDIQAADAMKFISTVSAASGLPTTGVGVGHTYKAIAEFGAADGVTIVFADEDDQVIHIGDLLIAQGNETDGVITANLKWLQIPSGYVADYNPELAVVDGVNSATINLTSGAYKDGTNLGSSVGAGDLGTVTLQGDIDSAIKVEASGNQVTISMAWGTF